MEPQTVLTSKSRIWIATVAAGLVALSLVCDSASRLIKPVPVVETFVRVGYWVMDVPAPRPSGGAAALDRIVQSDYVQD